MRDSLTREIKCIGITATARKVFVHDLKAPIDFLKSQGFRVKLSPYLFEADNQYAGCDAVRRKSMQLLMDDDEVDAILCAKGGYGSVRILDGLDWDGFVAKKKLLCGFSDITVFHAHLSFVKNWMSLHCTMPMSMLRMTDDDIKTSAMAMVKALRGEFDGYALKPHPLTREGDARGKLVGGNLSVLMSLLGSQTFGSTDGCILYLEDLDEYLYHVDRMMNALKRAGKLESLSALVLGSFSEMKDNSVPFGKTAEEIIFDAVKEYDFPVYFNVPSGHSDLNLPLLLGAEYALISGTLSKAP